MFICPSMAGKKDHRSDVPSSLRRCWCRFAFFVCGPSHLHITFAASAGECAQLGAG